MTDREFWDRYFSSLEDLAEEPPPSVKENLFHEMDRWQRWRRRLRKGAYGLIGLLLLGGSTFYLSGLNEEPSEDGFTDEGVAIWDPAFPGSIEEDELLVEKGAEEEKGKERPGVSPLEASASEQKEGTANKKAVATEERKAAPSREASADAKERSDGNEASVAPNGEKGSSSLEHEEEKAEGAKGFNKGIAERSNEDIEGERNGEGKKGASSRENIEKIPSKVPDSDEDFAITKVEGKVTEEMLQATLHQQRFFVGMDVLFNSTRVLDEPTIKSFDESSLVSTDPELFLDFALTGGVNVSDRSRILARYFVKKDFGQRYFQYREGRYSSQSLQLSYRSVDLLFEHDLTVGRPDPGFRTALSIYGGGHYSHLRKAIKTEDGYERSIGDELKANEYGVDLGMRFSFRSAQGLDVGLQLGGSYGLNDITQKGGAPSLSSDQAKNFSLGAGFSCRYHFAQGR